MVSGIVKRPVLRWHGGKWMIAPWIIEHFPPHKIYVEAFAGAASILLRKKRVHSEIYNDLDDGVVNLFRILRDPVKAEKLTNLLRLTPFARKEFDDSYGPDSTDTIERARILVVRSYQGFGSDSSNKSRATGFRVNASRGGTSPGGDFANYPKNIIAVTNRLRGVMIEKEDALKIMQRFDGPDTLHYCDPPYLAEVRSKCPGVYAHEMDKADHRNLAKVARAMKGAVIVSGYASPLYDELYKGWGRSERKVNTNMKYSRIEVLWFNRKAKQSQRNLF